MKQFRWREINQVPHEGGVYAWYFTPELTEYDSTEFVTQVLATKALDDKDASVRYIEQFLEQHIFHYFIEQPYKAEVSGPLKPRYFGMLQHQPALSNTLVQRLIEKPERIKAIRQILASSVPNFSSPIYIGMSKDLGKRLARHKALIEKYQETPTLVVNIETMLEEDQRDHSFAKEACARGIPPSLLSVIIEPVVGIADEWVDIENILNRIHFPLLGRN